MFLFYLEYFYSMNSLKVDEKVSISVTIFNAIFIDVMFFIKRLITDTPFIIINYPLNGGGGGGG